MFILFIKRNEQPNCDFAILRFCDFAITSYTIHLTFPFPPLKKFFPHSLCHFANISESSGTGTSTRTSEPMYLPTMVPNSILPLALLPIRQIYSIVERIYVLLCCIHPPLVVY